MKKTRNLAALSAAALLLTLTACTQEPAEVVKDTSSTSQNEDTQATSDEPSSDIVDEGTEAVSDEDSAPEDTLTALGETVRMSDWDVTVTKVLLNANADIAKANMFNDKPKGQYVLVTYKAKYTGNERKADVTWDLTWSWSTPDGKVHDQSYNVTPADDKDWPTETRKGGTVEQQVLFDIKPKQIKGSILSVEDWDNYADFAVS
jgi:hypothetical protein